jgi:RimJ/RimL family protein N-acetyltransferase
MSVPTMVSGDYPTELLDYLTLPDGRRLRIRALRRCEEGPIRDLYAHLSPSSRYLRFFSPMPELPASVMRLLACVDYRRTLALVAEHENGALPEPIGLASFGAIDDFSVELALVVRDEWQHHRVRTELATRLLQAAENRGFHRFVVHALSENVAIRRLLKDIGVVFSSKRYGNVFEFEFRRRALS